MSITERVSPGSVRLLLLLVFLTAWAVDVKATVVNGDDFNANTTTGIMTLQQWYSAGGLWNSTGWWNAANCIDAVENGIVANNGQNYFNILSNTFRLNSSGNFLDDFYDDEGWWAEAWIKAYDLTGNAQYLNMAKTIFSDMTNAWDTTQCNGGIWWDKPHTYKNAIANELFLLVAARLHERTPTDAGIGSYFYWATNEYTWFTNSGMINAQHLINDGLANCVNNGETTWTYNQGVILAGLADLYKITGNSNYLTQAETLANAAAGTLALAGVLREPCETTGCGGGDVPQFKGIFARHLTYLYDVDHNANYYNFLFRCAHSVWFSDRNVSNQFGLKWTGPFDSADAARHSSALTPISALAAPSTAQLFFAKGSGDSAFNHSVGQAAGTLAWSCGPTTSSGLMQSGPYLSSLPVGPHVVHFRMAVNALSNSAVNLAQIFVLNQGLSVAVSNVTWSAFAATNQFQDFALAFTNTATTSSYEFRAFWLQIVNAPILTLSDITADGFHNWSAANLAHNLGRLDGFNAWEADPVRDTSSGFLVMGPGTSELAAGPYRAQFELKVDNFNWDNSIVANLSVVNLDSNTVVATQSVSRSQFHDTLFHAFTLNFQAVAGAHYDFRTYWNYAIQAPRLTQRSLVVAPVGSAAFTPIPLAAGSYNQDLVVEHTAPTTPASTHTTASMDSGTSNTGNSWYEKGYDASAPLTGLPAAGTTITNQSASDRLYTFASSYTAANAVYIDSTHTAMITPLVSSSFSALSFLTAAGHGPVVIDYTVHHTDGTSETGAFTSPDWFFNTPIAWSAQGRVDIATGSFNNVNNNNPNLYAEDITLTNTASPITRINLNWNSGNGSGSVGAIFAVSGVTPSLTPSSLLVTPASQTQYVGTSATFSIGATGTLPFSYQWQSNGLPISRATNSTLILSGLTTNATANYVCVVNNNGGSAASPPAPLTVLPLPLLNAGVSNGTLTLTWTNGTLLEATNITGPWISTPTATSPYKTIIGESNIFYRIKVQ